MTQGDVTGLQRTLQELDVIRQVKVTKQDDPTKRQEFERIFAEIAPYEKVARAIVPAATDDKFDQLKEIVAEPADNHEVRDKLDRYQIDLRLIAARELILRLPSVDPSLPKVVEKLYDMIPPRQGACRIESQPYRREYYEFGLTAWLPALDSRIARTYRLLGGGCVLPGGDAGGAGR